MIKTKSIDTYSNFIHKIIISGKIEINNSGKFIFFEKDNIFFKKIKLSGIIDFYFAANDYFMYEIAICINALCFDHKKRKFHLNKKKIKNLIKGYESVKKISMKEKKSINILCRGAALRYLLTRLYDYSNTPKTALIKIKDPDEYFQKLLSHNNLSSFKDYLN